LWKWWQIRQATALIDGKIPLPRQQSTADCELLNAQIAMIRAAREPLSTEEMSAFYRLPSGTPDLTEQYLALIQPFYTTDYKDKTRELPVVGDAEASLPPLDVSTDLSNAIKSYLQEYASSLSALENLAQESGGVRFPLAFKDGLNMSLEHDMAVRSAAQALRLRFLIFLQEEKFKEARHCLLARWKLSETIAREPTLVSQLVRLVIQGDVIRDTSLFVASRPQTDDELLAWQQVLVEIDFERGMVESLIGERAMLWHTMHHELSKDGDFFGNAHPLNSHDDVDAILRMRDCAAGLEIMSDAIRNARQGFPDALKDLDQWDRRVRQLALEQQATLHPDYIGTIVNMPAFEAYFTSIASSVALQRLVLGQLAVARFHAHHARLPATLAELTPEYTTQSLVDPWDGAPLRYVRQDNSATLYSIGRDEIDNGGEGDLLRQEPDIVLNAEFGNAMSD
jgi:hypothetical protein